MTSPMTPERKEEIKRLIAEASPGPWIYDETVGDVYAVKTDEIICSDVHNAPFIAEAITLVPELMAALEDAEQKAEHFEVVSSAALDHWEETEKSLAEAQQTIARQREALEWYANVENYEIGNYTSMRGEIPTDWESKIQQEAGEKAREALGEGAKES